ncbi:isoprenoid synthase domain-containing protein [Bombardia bombarda]|uniref:Terpene synthase n=1 Tax=Bombardia bombarda TaxID=252184 RepID=A0AA40C8Y4_9PEZI|nr:isoprenoid synthase domain-containing protein [Bombardia bombarda]
MAVTSVAEISARLRGQTLCVPNLHPFYSQWPKEISPYYEQLKVTIENKIQEWISDERVRKAARDVDLPTFCATWWPNSSLHRLETMAWYSLWIILWDDVVEYAESDNPTTEQTLKYVEFQLGLSKSTEAPETPTKYCELLKYAAPALKADLTLVERQRLYNEIKYYLEGCELEQTFVQAGAMPSLENYWDHRFGTSAVNTYNALGEYMCGGHIPERIYDTPELKTLWFELNRHIVILNDLLSLRNEVPRDWPGLVHILIDTANTDLETAVATMLDMLRISADKIDVAADKLVTMAAEQGGPKAKSTMEDYVSAFKANMTGNYYWSLVCPRYGNVPYTQEDGTIVIPL